MKKRYLSIIALAFVFGIATVFTSCGNGDEEAQKEAEAVEDVFEEALSDVDSTTNAVVDSAAAVVDSVATDVTEKAADAVEGAKDAVVEGAKDAVEKVTK
ncbi:MAG: hypothetical protein GXO49_08220 [Chlorobi bacterium]|nr:hypothetical protein [Chlorobiota bacterium]